MLVELQGSSGFQSIKPSAALSSANSTSQRSFRYKDQLSIDVRETNAVCRKK